MAMALAKAKDCGLLLQLLSKYANKTSSSKMRSGIQSKAKATVGVT